MFQKSLGVKIPFRSNKYKKVPEIPVFLTKQFADLRLRLKKNNQIGQANNSEKRDAVIEEDDCHETNYDYKTVYIDGFCDDCLRVYTCGLLNCGDFSKLKHSSDK
jgi:hypothetical protein